MREPRPGGPLRDDFFIPELCRPEALFALVLLSELLVLVLVLAEPMQAGFDWIRLALTSLFVQWIVLLSGGLLCFLRPLLARLPAGLAGFACCMLVMGLTLACTAFADLYGLSNGAAGDPSRYLRHALIGLLMSGLLLRYAYLRMRWRQQEQAELQSRIEALQARIRPHFLFNSLNSIASLVAIDPVRAEQAVLDLSDVFRASLARSGTLVTWAEELALAQRYLAIERYRLAERLQLEWAVDELPGDTPIPQLTLQPLLENAVIHGIEPRVEGGCIRVEARLRAGWVELVVSNPCADRARPAARGARQGLSNIEARLAALFGPSASLSVERRNDRHYTWLRYPVAGSSQEYGSI